MKRLAVARLWHEGNSFSPVPTTLSDFKRREWLEGDAAQEHYDGTATEMGAVVEFARHQAGRWSVAFLPAMGAPPGGPVPDRDFAQMAERIVEAIRAARADAIYLSLHGSMVTETNPTPERDLIRAVAAAAPGVPIGISFDFHANLAAEMLEGAAVASGYRTYPHIDMGETAQRVLTMLTGIADRGSLPVRAVRKIPFVLLSHNMRTDAGPMADLMALGASAEAELGILDASIFGGFSYGDTPYAGPTIMVHAEQDRGLAERTADRLAAAYAQRLDDFRVRLPAPAEGIKSALAHLAAGARGPVAVLDPADNPMSGGIGDTPAILAALLRERPTVPSVFAFLGDPGVVAQAHAAGAGAILDLKLGGRLTNVFGPPVAAQGRVLRLTDGRFRNHGPMERGLAVDLGRTCVLDVNGIELIVTESCQTPNDRGYFDLHGIDLSGPMLLCVKAKNHFRAAFGRLCTRIVDVDCPGPATADLASLPFRHLPSGVRPLAA
jgi:microcystin degradation protein MlrC